MTSIPAGAWLLLIVVLICAAGHVKDLNERENDPLFISYLER